MYASRTLKCVKDKLLSVYTEPSVAIMFTSNIQQRPEDKHTTPRETHDLELSDKTGCAEEAVEKSATEGLYTTNS